MSSSLSSNQLEKLKREIRECSERREQSLNQLKEWIIKHPFISNFNMDETILLAFIRARKYRMDRVFESIDKSSILMKVHNEWFDYKGEKLQRGVDLYDTGFLKVMKQRDNEGRRILHSDDIFLPFLRAKKYEMNKTYESIEKTVFFIKHHKNWSDWRGENLKRVIDLYDTGFLVVLKERDYEGRRIIVCRNRLDIAKFTADDVFRLYVLLFTALQNEEATQICGAIVIEDYSLGITMNFMMMFPIKHSYDFAIQLKSTPVRLKHLLIVGLPSFATNALNIFKHGLSDTIKKRLQVLNEFCEIKKYIDMSLLPKEYSNSGKYSKAEMLEAFKPWLLYHAEKIGNIFNNVEVDFRKVDAYKHHYVDENIGSFRKLEID
ncbi:hypothetical protein PVAND_000096 [Polypedilum vanderplanki]|uniref:CRAL-TRIO domain-containing protein n=1 Tax=Polypedilum vanderplanki TaxID=319348 RepID=A0A9J6BJT3_POLVA|nr:hypothetical protein PVAND_000096 [Polypedilum vanderplanki]